MATKEEAEKRVTLSIEQYNNVRLHSAIGYVTPVDKLAGLDKRICDERDRKLVEARSRRELARKAQRQVA